MLLIEQELDNSVVEESSVTASDGKNYLTKLQNLDMIISVGYRVKSQRGILFRRWANEVLKDYLIQRYALNQKRLKYLNKRVICFFHVEIRYSLVYKKQSRTFLQIWKTHVFVEHIFEIFYRCFKCFFGFR